MLLFNYNIQFLRFIAVAQTRGEKCTKMLLKSGADTNMAMADGRTPLHISSESGTLAVLRQLLANGANPLLVDSVSHTVKLKPKSIKNQEK